jgi:hypothetical protein
MDQHDVRIEQVSIFTVRIARRTSSTSSSPDEEGALRTKTEADCVRSRAIVDGNTAESPKLKSNMIIQLGFYMY